MSALSPVDALRQLSEELQTISLDLISKSEQIMITEPDQEKGLKKLNDAYSELEQQQTVIMEKVSFHCDQVDYIQTWVENYKAGNPNSG